MSNGFQIVVCGSIVPDPLQKLEPITGPTGPALKNEMMLPAVLDPWAGHALYEAANAGQKNSRQQSWRSAWPQAKLNRFMMTIARGPLEWVALDVRRADLSKRRNREACETTRPFRMDRSRLLVFGGWESASRGAGATMQMVGERRGIVDQFQGVDELTVQEDGSLKVLERIEGGRHLVSRVSAPPALFGWATGNLPEPPNNPQVGMMNMRAVMPALQKAQPAKVASEGLAFVSVELPKQKRETIIERNKSANEVAWEIMEWIKG
jgi:electron transfer flavoprotein beta subunit